jgi:spore maturation protein CgeB
MKLLYVALRHDYGDPSRGHSFEHETFVPALRSFATEFIYFEIDTLLRVHGFGRMQSLLWDIVQRQQPDVLFCVLFENQLDRAVLRRISTESATVTLNWFCDDHWRFEAFSRHWAPSFNWVATTSREAFHAYQMLPGVHPILTQWATNIGASPRIDADEAHDVVFIGQWRPIRERYVRYLRAHGIDVAAYGHGWPAGRLRGNEMMEVLGSSRIGLNFSEASSTSYRFRRPKPQLKARPFELGASGTAIVSEDDPDIRGFYEPDKEIVIFKTRRSLYRAVRELLDDEEKRSRIATAGHQRTLLEHTYTQRFARIFSTMGVRHALTTKLTT